VALGNPFNIGSKAQASGVSTTVVTAGTDANSDATTMPAAGNSLFVLIGMSSTSVSPSSVTDNRGNTYTPATNGSFVPSIGQSCWVYECLNPAFTLVSTDTVTVHWSATTAATSNVRVIGCSGVASSSADDQSGTGSGSGTSASATAGGTLAQASELAVAIVQSGNATSGISSWGTFGQMGHNLHSGSGSYFGVATLDTASTGAPSASATFGTSGNWAMLLLTFKASTAGAGGLSITTASPLPGGQVGVAYTDQLAASGGITPYTWSVSSGSLPAGLSLSSGISSGGTGGGGDVTYVGLNAGPQGAPTVSQLTTCNSAFGPAGYTKFFYSSGGSGIYTGYLGGDINGGGTSGWSTSGGSAGYTPAAITAAIPGIFIIISWGVKMSATAISNFVGSIPTTVAEVGFSFQSEPENAYALSAGSTFVADWTDQANKIRAAQATTPVKLTLITSHYEGNYQNGTLTNSSFIPPASVVDAYGLDFYDRAAYAAGPDMSTNKAWVVWTGFVKGLGKPLALTEYGISGYTATAQNSRLQADWQYIQNAFGTGGTLSKYPLYAWLYWNTNGTSLSTSSPGTNINQMLSTAMQQQWAAIESTAGGQNTGTVTGTGGVISGTPTSSGTSTPVIQVADSVGTTATKSLSITISASSALAITTTSPLPGATTGVSYTTLLTATGGTTPYTWSLQSGTLPAGLAISGQTITGTPSAAGASSFVLKVTDNVAATATLSASLTVSAALAITTTSLPGATAGTAYTATVVATGGTFPYTFAITSGALPAGLTLDTDGSLTGTAGTITGTPSGGSSSFTVTATDTAGATASAQLAITVTGISGGGTVGRRKFGGGISDWTFATGTAGAGMTNPMTAASDLIVGGSAGLPARLAAGSHGQVLAVGSSGTVAWANTPVDWVNVVTAYGADPTGVADSTAAISNALAAVPSGGQTVYLPAGTYLLNGASALTLSVAGTRLTGAGPGTVIKIGASFSAAEAVNITADACVVSDLSIVGASTTVTSNPVADAIQLVGQQRCRIRDVFFQYVNGWAIDAQGSASRGSLDLMIRGIVARNCAAGIHCLGVTGSSFLGEYFLTDLQMQQMGATTGGSANLDALLIEDISDVLVQGVNIGTASGTTAGAIHVKGACATVKLTNVDVGTNTAATVAPAIFVESGTNGTPGDVTIINGGAEGGVATCRVDAGTDIVLTNFRVHQAYNSGLVINGGEVLVIGCSMAANNQSGGTGYDIDCSAMTTGNARFVACRTESSLGTATPGQVTNPVAASSHGYFDNCYFIASNNAPSTVFAVGTPQRIKNCVGYNPRGSITAPTIGASPFTSNTSQQDVLIIFTAVNTLTAFKIGGTATSVLPVNGQAYFVPARSSLELDYSGAAPTWQWYGC
jgi:hypothetical protein